jgi:short-subunit dehydrogenase
MQNNLPRMPVYATSESNHIQLMSNYDFDRKSVLITGASTGIGASFARALAARGAKLILVARSQERLDALARELGGAEVIVQDLTQPSAAKSVLDAVAARGLVVDVLINNAGFATFGPFADSALASLREQIDLNVGALVELTHTFLPMLEQRAGGVIHVASTAAFQPLPYMAVYGATKAFVLSFSEALWCEYRRRGVRVLALCPGATDTPFFERAGEAAAYGKKAAPEAVVQRALRAFDHGRSHVIDGSANYWTAQSSRLLPREAVLSVTERIMRGQMARALKSAVAAV